MKVKQKDGTLADPGPDEPEWAEKRKTHKNDPAYGMAEKEINGKFERLLKRRVN